MDLIQTECAIIDALESANGFVTGISHGPLTEQAIASLVSKGVLTEVDEGWMLGEQLTA